MSAKGVLQKTEVYLRERERKRETETQIINHIRFLLIKSLSHTVNCLAAQQKNGPILSNSVIIPTKSPSLNYQTYRIWTELWSHLGDQDEWT